MTAPETLSGSTFRTPLEPAVERFMSLCKPMLFIPVFCTNYSKKARKRTIVCTRAKLTRRMFIHKFGWQQDGVRRYLHRSEARCKQTEGALWPPFVLVLHEKMRRTALHPQPASSIPEACESLFWITYFYCLPSDCPCIWESNNVRDDVALSKTTITVLSNAIRRKNSRGSWLSCALDRKAFMWKIRKRGSKHSAVR